MAIPPPQLLDAAAAAGRAAAVTWRDAIAFGIGAAAGIAFCLLVVWGAAAAIDKQHGRR